MVPDLRDRRRRSRRRRDRLRLKPIPAHGGAAEHVGVVPACRREVVPRLLVRSAQEHDGPVRSEHQARRPEAFERVRHLPRDVAPRVPRGQRVDADRHLERDVRPCGEVPHPLQPTARMGPPSTGGRARWSTTIAQFRHGVGERAHGRGLLIGDDDDVPCEPARGQIREQPGIDPVERLAPHQPADADELRDPATGRRRATRRRRPPSALQPRTPRAARCPRRPGPSTVASATGGRSSGPYAPARSGCSDEASQKW